MTPLERYQRDLRREGFAKDFAQEQAVVRLNALYHGLIEAPPATTKPSRTGLLGRLKARQAAADTAGQPRGLYLWGGVGRGKTYLVDAFFECLPFQDKRRIHFHRFMQRIHAELRLLRDRQSPLTLVGRKLAREARVLCLDEFFVSDITDAMLMFGLLKTFFDEGVALVATSNVAPERLYWDGLQRARFLPAIELIEERMDIVHLDGGVDYRLRQLEQAEIYHSPLDDSADSILADTFEHLAPEPGVDGVVLEIDGRGIQTRRHADGVVWFDFGAVCDGPRGTADYIEIARCYHTVFISEVPQLSWEMDNQARRFLNLVDEFYDRNVKLVMSGAVPLEELYQGTTLSFEYRRAVSRLREMQSHEYLAREHLP